MGNKVYLKSITTAFQIESCIVRNLIRSKHLGHGWMCWIIPIVLGDYVWTGFDYLGEASIGWLGYPHEGSFYPWNHAFCGDIDIYGFKRQQSYYRNVLLKQLICLIQMTDAILRLKT